MNHSSLNLVIFSKIRICENSKLTLNTRQTFQCNNINQLNDNLYNYSKLQLKGPMSSPHLLPKQSKTLPCVIFIIANLLVCGESALTISETHISTTRNADRTSICSYSELTYSQSDISASNTYINQYSFLSTQQIEAMIFSNNYTQLKTQTILLLAPHIVAFIVFAIIWLPLCCCCVWPQKHPVCKKCRKPEKQMYGKCEVKWTAYCATFFFMAIMAGGILGIIKGVDIVSYFNDVGCKTAAVADDTLNGRLSPTVQNRFFVGLSPFSTDLTSLNSSFNTIWTQNQNSLQNAGDVRSKQTIYDLFIESIYTAYTNPTYIDAFTNDATGTNFVNVNSQFKNMHYGPTNVSTTILGTIKSTTTTIFTQINAVLDPMIAAYTNLSATTESTVRSQMGTTVDLIGTLSVTLTNFITNWNKFFNNQALFDQVNLLLKLFYGIFFGLSILGFLGGIILACFSVVKVRLIMYFACAFLFFFGFISFILVIMLAALAPNLAQVCSYMDTKLTTGAGTNDLFTRLGFNQMGNLYQNCMSDGTGWIINDVSPTFNTTFADLVLISQNTQLFNLVIPNYSTANLTAPFTSGQTKVTQISNAQVYEINDTNAINHLTQIHQIGFPMDVACNTLNVNGDSWAPSYNLFSCPGGKAQNTPCLDLSSLTICPQGCYQIQNQFQSSSGDGSYRTNLAIRYGDTNCNYFQYLVKLQNNWTLPRQASMSQVTTDLTNLQSKITDYDTTFKGTQANISTYKNILESSYNGLTNLTSGTFNGLDCRVLGQSIIDMRNSICVGLLNSVYYNLICLIIISYSILFAACCTVCAGVRHFRHLQKMQIHVGYKGVPVSISDTSKIITQK